MLAFCTSICPFYAKASSPAADHSQINRALVHRGLHFARPGLVGSANWECRGTNQFMPL